MSSIAFTHSSAPPVPIKAFNYMYSYKELSKLPITEECERAYGAVKMCDRCKRVPKSNPCQQTCEAVAQLCTGAPSDFASIWKQFFDSATEFSNQYYLEALLEDLPTLLKVFNQNLKSAILNATFIDFQSVLSNPIFSQCETYKTGNSEGLDLGSQRFNFEERTPRASFFNSGIQQNLTQYKDVASFIAFLNESSLLFRSVENHIVGVLCPDEATETNCGSGVTQLRTSARPRFTFDSALNYTHVQTKSLQYKTQFYANYTILLSEYTQQVQTGGISRAGLALLEETSCLPSTNLTDDDCDNADEMYDAYEDEFQEGSADYEDEGVDKRYPNSDDEDGLEGSAVPDDSSGFDDSEDTTVEDTTVASTTAVIQVTHTSSRVTSLNDQPKPKPPVPADKRPISQSSSSCSLFSFTCCAHHMCFSILCAIFAFPFAFYQ